MRRSFAALLFALAPLTGCASMSYHPNVESVGAYADMKPVEDQADSMPSGDAANVKAVAGTVPEGMRLKDGALEVDTKRYQVLGKVSANPNAYGTTWLNLTFYDYTEEEEWRTAFCGWQVPLSWLTLTLWAFVSPLAYPCKVTAGDEHARRVQIVATLRRATKALGGDMVFFAFGGLRIVDGQSGVVVGAADAFRGEGFAIKVLHGDTTPAPPTASPAGLSARAFDLTHSL